ncbi:MAG: MlaD family protein, partial [Thermocrispum sp.]
MRNRRLLLGLVVVVAFAASVVVAVTSTNGLPWTPRTVVRAAFDEVGSLRAGDDVRIASVRVGYVGEVSYEDGRAIAELRFDGERPIYRNARAVAASVGARSALGQKYVDFSPGGPEAGRLAPGEIIPMTRTVGAQE